MGAAEDGSLMGAVLVLKSDFTNGMGKIIKNWTGRSPAASLPLTPENAVHGVFTLGSLPFRK